jgi:hypothetical protein
MADHKFRFVGASLLEGIEGDILLYDRTMKLDTVFTTEAMQHAHGNDSIAAMVGRQFLNFVKRHREIRMSRAFNQIKTIERYSTAIADITRGYLQKGLLRMAEREIYLYFRDNEPPQAEEAERLILKQSRNENQRH